MSKKYITQTRGKRGKKLQQIGVVLAIVGVIGICLPTPSIREASGIFLVLGIILFIKGRMSAWWHRGYKTGTSDNEKISS